MTVPRTQPARSTPRLPARGRSEVVSWGWVGPRRGVDATPLIQTRCGALARVALDRVAEREAKGRDELVVVGLVGQAVGERGAEAVVVQIFADERQLARSGLVGLPRLHELARVDHVHGVVDVPGTGLRFSRAAS